MVHRCMLARHILPRNMTCACQLSQTCRVSCARVSCATSGLASKKVTTSPAPGAITSLQHQAARQYAGIGQTIVELASRALTGSALPKHRPNVSHLFLTVAETRPSPQLNDCAVSKITTPCAHTEAYAPLLAYTARLTHVIHQPTNRKHASMFYKFIIRLAAFEWQQRKTGCEGREVRIANLLPASCPQHACVRTQWAGAG